jgi:hypothetical protein
MKTTKDILKFLNMFSTYCTVLAPVIMALIAIYHLSK